MMLGDMASGQVSMKIGAKGPNFSIVSACATGADSIGIASDMINDGKICLKVKNQLTNNSFECETIINEGDILL